MDNNSFKVTGQILELQCVISSIVFLHKFKRYPPLSIVYNAFYYIFISHDQGLFVKRTTCIWYCILNKTHTKCVTSQPMNHLFHLRYKYGKTCLYYIISCFLVCILFCFFVVFPFFSFFKEFIIMLYIVFYYC